VHFPPPSPLFGDAELRKQFRARSHLSDGDRAEVRRILESNLPEDVRVFAFGSRVHGRNLKPYSDLDLCLRAEKPLPVTVLTKLAADFEDSHLPYKVDVVDWGALSPEFRDVIAGDLEALA
jgi:predicted nucleotidyltransferase